MPSSEFWLASTGDEREVWRSGSGLRWGQEVTMIRSGERGRQVGWGAKGICSGERETDCGSRGIEREEPRRGAYRLGLWVCLIPRRATRERKGIGEGWVQTDRIPS